jgi:hypothetical protein
MFIHHLIAAAWLGERPAGMIIDHIDGDQQNNAASNLRYVTHSQNSMNRHASGASRTKYGRWQSKIKINGVTKCLGTFGTKTEAEEAHHAEKMKHLCA